MRSLRAVLLCALLVALALGSAPAGAQPAPSEEVRFEADIQTDGDARWSVVVRIPLENESDVESFEAFAERTSATDFGHSLSAFETAAEEASEAADREMEIVNATRESDVLEAPDDGAHVGVGELRLAFTWTNFARETNDQIVVDDAFNTTDGTWLPGLSDEQTLVIRPPEGYGVTTSPVAPRSGELRWEGPVSFSPGYFEVVYQPGVGPAATPESPEGPGLTTILLVGALLLSAAALTLGLYLLWRRDDEEIPDPSPTADGPIEDGAVLEGDDGGIDPELLSDEEWVEQILERNGGRMKQAQIVQETDWSNAKVSQLLSSMAEEDRIEKLRIGRENLISLPGEEIGEFDEN